VSLGVLFVAPSAYPLGGVATWLDYIVPGLRKRAWKVTLALVQGRFHDVDAYLTAHPHDQVLRIPYGTGTKEGRVRQLIRAILSERPDIVVAVNIADVVPAVDRIRATSGWSPRVVMALHAVQADFLASIGYYAAALDGVVCVNRLACELVARSTSVEPSRIYYAPCGVDIYDTVKEQRNSEELLRIAYVGRLERVQKRLEDVVCLVAELDRRHLPYQLIIAGSGPDGEWLRVQLSEAVGGGRVQFLGALADHDVSKRVYSCVDALLITSLWETGPIVAWEAMANRVAVVTSAYIGSGLEGSLRPGDNCLMFPIGDTVAAADCLERLRNAQLRGQLLRGGLALVAQRYSTTASIEQWSESLRSIAARMSLSVVYRGADKAHTPPAGRLDRLLGRQLGENIRELLGLKYEHTEPGAEWPHASPHSELDEEAFWQLAASLDCDSQRKDISFRQEHETKGGLSTGSGSPVSRVKSQPSRAS
jgi:glycosyltransferase involved in cell wall biosynthesis